MTTITYPASEKQIAFATRLLNEKAHTFNTEQMVQTLPSMGKRGVSALIDELMALPRQGAAPKISEGYYVKDDVVYKVQANRAGTGVYGKRLVLTTWEQADDIDSDTRFVTSGSWEYEPGLTRNLVGLEPLTIEVAAQMGVASGVCVICGRTLDNPKSIARGIGPVCATRI